MMTFARSRIAGPSAAVVSRSMSMPASKIPAAPAAKPASKPASPEAKQPDPAAESSDMSVSQRTAALAQLQRKVSKEALPPPPSQASLRKSASAKQPAAAASPPTEKPTKVSSPPAKASSPPIKTSPPAKASPPVKKAAALEPAIKQDTMHPVKDQEQPLKPTPAAAPAPAPVTAPAATPAPAPTAVPAERVEPSAPPPAAPATPVPALSLPAAAAAPSALPAAAATSPHQKLIQMEEDDSVVTAADSCDDEEEGQGDEEEEGEEPADVPPRLMSEEPELAPGTYLTLAERIALATPAVLRRSEQALELPQAPQPAAAAASVAARPPAGILIGGSSSSSAAANAAASKHVAWQDLDAGSGASSPRRDRRCGGDGNSASLPGQHLQFQHTFIKPACSQKSRKPLPLPAQPPKPFFLQVHGSRGVQPAAPRTLGDRAGHGPGQPLGRATPLRRTRRRGNGGGGAGGRRHARAPAAAPARAQLRRRAVRGGPARARGRGAEVVRAGGASRHAEHRGVDRGRRVPRPLR